MSDLADAVTVLERIAEAIERNAAGIEGLLSIQERDEVRRAVKGLLKLRAKYPVEPERAPLRVVK